MPLDYQTFPSSAGEEDFPLELGNLARYYSTTESIRDTEKVQGDTRTNCWDLNYREAAIFIEEGISNDKLTAHPKNRQTLDAYLLVHNKWFYAVDFIASMLLILLAFAENPARPTFKLPVSVHGSIELVALLILAVQLAMKYLWLGSKTFLRNLRFPIKAVTLVVMMVEAIVVLGRQKPHFRVTRLFRPLFLLDNQFSGRVRRYLRQTLRAIPSALDILGLLLFVILFYSVLGYYLFGANAQDPNFTTLAKAFVSLFVLLTTSNYPDVMMPAYAESRWAVVFFVSYLVIVLYFILNLLLAAAYASFSEMAKEKLKRLVLNRRKAAQHAHRLLLSENNAIGIPLHHFRGLMQYVDPSKSVREVYLTFRVLNASGSGSISQNEFLQIFNVLDMKWAECKDSCNWFERCEQLTIARLARRIHRIVTSTYFEYFVCFVILCNAGAILARTAYLSRNPVHLIEISPIYWETYAFGVFFILEACLKLFALGPSQYFSSRWNVFDFAVTALLFAGLAVEIAGRNSALVEVIHLRVLRLFKLRKRYRDVFGTVIFMIGRFVCAGIVFLIVYYAYSIVGMELFAGYDLKNCCKNTSVEDSYRFENGSSRNGYYYLNNFDDVISSYVTLFELTVINNWYVIMEGYAAATTEWSRLYFMSFYLTIMVLLSIVVASVLDGFMFRMSRIQQTTGKDENLLSDSVTLTGDEIEQLKAAEESREKWLKKRSILRRLRRNAPSNSYESAEEPPVPSSATLTYKGCRHGTSVLLNSMFKDDIQCWVEQAEMEERKESRNSSLANSSPLNDNDHSSSNID